jgi:hypothetical protein
MNLMEKQFEQVSRHLSDVWDLYLKFYTGFLTVNFAALAVAVQYIEEPNDRLPLTVAFIAQNILSLVTAIGIAKYTRFAYAKQRDVISLLAERESLTAKETEAAQSSIPVQAGTWGGIANAASHVLFILCWIGVIGIGRGWFSGAAY